MGGILSFYSFFGLACLSSSDQSATGNSIASPPLHCSFCVQASTLGSQQHQEKRKSVKMIKVPAI